MNSRFFPLLLLSSLLPAAAQDPERVDERDSVVVPDFGSLSTPPRFAHSHADFHRAHLGAFVEPLDPQIRPHLGLPEPVGMLIREVVEGSPAARLGLQDGDILVKFGEDRIVSVEQLRVLLASLGSSGVVSVEILRAGESQVLQGQLDALQAQDQPEVEAPIQPEAQPESAGPEQPGTPPGITEPALQPTAPATAEPLPATPPEAVSPPVEAPVITPQPAVTPAPEVPEMAAAQPAAPAETPAPGRILGALVVPVEGGLRVSRVLPASAASRAGIQADDVLIQLDGKPLATSADVRSALEAAGPAPEVRLRRADQEQVVPLDFAGQ